MLSPCFQKIKVVGCALVFLASTLCCSAWAADVSPGDIIAHHLASLGTPQARNGLKSLVIQGTLNFRILVGGGGGVTGSGGRVSEEHQSSFVMRFGTGDWRGEQFTYDGQRTSFAAATSSHRRSAFAQFVSSQDFIIKEGLLGGELSTGWALQNLDQNRPKLISLGAKKVDGRNLLAVQYLSKNSSDMEVTLYFDPDTYRHVKTVYSVSLSANMGGEVTMSGRQQNIRYTIEERFGDFETVDGITIPRHYDLRYTQELQSGNTRAYDWEMTADQVRANIPLDPANFRPK